MSENTRKQNDSSSSSDKHEQKAVPYVPPPPPDENELKKLRSPLINGMLAAIVILILGFMAYNFVGHAFTRVAGESSVNSVTPSPGISPEVSHVTSPSNTPSYSTSPAPSQ